ncbi:MAG: gliding motility-associated C-terminal domain-containing protein [Bacteroidia bacterium]
MRRVCSTPDGDVVIFWKSFSDTCSSFEKLYIYGKEKENEPYEIIDSVFDISITEYLHLGAKVLSQQWKYYIEVFYDCNGIGTLLSDTMSIDFTAPDQVLIDSVSVVDGMAQIGWQQSSNLDSRGYYVYLYDGFDNNILDTLDRNDITGYLDSLTGDPEQKAERYRVAAYDSCGNISLLGAFHRTIFLEESVDTCAGTISLEWTGYQGWQSDLAGYEIWMEKNGGGFIRIDSVGDVGSYVFENGERDTNYCFYVRAIHRNGVYTSSSNRICTEGDFVSYEGEVYLRKVTVVDSLIEVHWWVSEEEFLGGFELSRGGSPLTMSMHREIPATGGANYVFTDSSADPNEQVYHYEVAAKSVCGVIAGRSNVSHNILLRIQNKEFTELTWNEYDGWSGGVESYEVQRSNSSELPLTFINIADLQRMITEFPDSEQIEEIGNLGVCYVIRGVEGDTNSYGFKEDSYSNMVCVIDDAVIHVPNAFRPEGPNNTFAPRGLFIDYSNSTMTVYDRWGGRLFETHDVMKGWDGTGTKGEQVPEGVYFYKMIIWGLDGSRHILDGNVTKF